MEYATNGSFGSTTTAYSFGVQRESFVETTAGMGAGATIGGMTYQTSGTYYYTGTGSVANVTGTVTNQSYSYTTSGSMTAYAMSTSAGVAGNTTSTLTTNPTAYGTYGVYGYNGEYTHTSLGLQYLRARYLNMATGTFTSKDTYAGRMQDILSQNRYTYAENNPVGHSDPSGHAVSTKQRALNATRNAINAYATQQRAKNEIAQYEALKLKLNASLAKAEQSRAKAERIEKPLEWYQSASAWVDKGLVKVAGYLDSSWSGPYAEAFATWVVEKECQAYDYCVNKIQEAIPGSDGTRVLKGAGLILGGAFKATGGITIGALSTTVSWAGIGIPGIFAGTTTAAAGASDIQQGTEELYLGIIGDSTTKTENGLANMWFGGDEILYHTTTGIAGFAGNFGIPKLATRFPNNSALINGANETNIAEKAGLLGKRNPSPNPDTTRINLAKGQTRFTPLRESGQPVSAGMNHIVSGHFDRPLGNSRSIFSISVDHLKEILQRKSVVASPIRDMGGGQYERIVNVGEMIGNTALKYGGNPTSYIKIITDVKGNIITAYPVPEI